MDTQKTAWGYVEWLSPDSAGQRAPSMSVGVVTINPHAHQEKHIHYENEQFIYILQGTGTEYINGEEHILYEGLFYYLSPNITHELFNTGDEPIRHLLVSVSTSFTETAALSEEDTANFSTSFFSGVEAIRDQILTAALPSAIFDDMGNLILQNNKYPEYCMRHCDPLKKHDHCPCFANRNDYVGTQGNVGKVCPYGLTVFRLPILYQGKLYGSIYSGHILLHSSASDLPDMDMYDTPHGTSIAIQKWMVNISRSIISYCSFDSLRQSLRQKDSLIFQKQQDQQMLEADLKAMKNTVTNLKINHHFLYNTLNAIAGQALEGDRLSTYQAIIDLAKMFRYSTAVNMKLVPLRSELEYLNTYLHMQQIRYGEDLSVNLAYAESILEGLVPFNFLQPIVENAFTHGFTEFSAPKKLQISIDTAGSNLVFSIRNNGSVVDAVTLNRVMRGLESNSGHGLALVYSKLQAAYGSRFSFQIFSEEVSGTQVVLTIPYQI